MPDFIGDRSDDNEDGNPFCSPKPVGSIDVISGNYLYELKTAYPHMPVDDYVVPGLECTCEFTPNPEESGHYLRRCRRCQHTWYGLHCPHDGYQNPCPKCRTIPTPISEK